MGSTNNITMDITMECTVEILDKILEQFYKRPMLFLYLKIEYLTACSYKDLDVAWFLHNIDCILSFLETYKDKFLPDFSDSYYYSLNLLSFLKSWTQKEQEDKSLSENYGELIPHILKNLSSTIWLQMPDEQEEVPEFIDIFLPGTALKRVK
jgi:hypothetical protein